MTNAIADERMAVHLIEVADGGNATCSCTWTGTQEAAREHAREVKLCRDCWGSGEGASSFYGGDDSGIDDCATCGGAGTAEAEDEQARISREIDLSMGRADGERYLGEMVFAAVSHRQEDDYMTRVVVHYRNGGSVDDAPKPDSADGVPVDIAEEIAAGVRDCFRFIRDGGMDGDPDTRYLSRRSGATTR